MKKIIITMFAVLALTSTAFADTPTTGTITRLYRAQSQSDIYALEHGHVLNDGGVIVYWGGSKCSGFTEPPAEAIALLAEAALSSKVVTLSYKLQATTHEKCLVGFEIRF